MRQPEETSLLRDHETLQVGQPVTALCEWRQGLVLALASGALTVAQHQAQTECRYKVCVHHTCAVRTRPPVPLLWPVASPRHPDLRPCAYIHRTPQAPGILVSMRSLHDCRALIEGQHWVSRRGCAHAAAAYR